MFTNYTFNLQLLVGLESHHSKWGEFVLSIYKIPQVYTVIKNGNSNKYKTELNRW